MSYKYRQLKRIALTALSVVFLLLYVITHNGYSLLATWFFVLAFVAAE